MRKTRVCILCGLAILAVACVVLLCCEPILLKCLLNTARVMPGRMHANIHLDGVAASDAFVFSETRRFDGAAANRLVLWLPARSLGRMILIVDIEGKTVGLPNAGRTDYAIVCGRLIQSESGDMMVPITADKAWPEHDLDLRSDGHVIEFQLPEEDWMPCRSVRVEADIPLFSGLSSTPGTLALARGTRLGDESMPAVDHALVAELYDVYVRTDIDVPFSLAKAEGYQCIPELTSGTGRLSVSLRRSIT